VKNIETKGGWVKIGDSWVDSAKVEMVYVENHRLHVGLPSRCVFASAEDFPEAEVLETLDLARKAALAETMSETFKVTTQLSQAIAAKALGLDDLDD
jgi:hypothetical protein